MKRPLFIILLLCFVISGGAFVSRSKGQGPPILLQVSEVFFNDVLALTYRSVKEQERFYVFHNNNIIIYNEKRDILSNIITGGNFYPIDPAVDSEGNIYLINSANDEIAVLNQAGQWYRSFRLHERPYSLALLSNGTIVIASPSGGKLLHIYDTTGRKLRSFGEIKLFDAVNKDQNLFLNRGKVVVDSSDSIYFVFKYAPKPAIVKFTRKGKPVSEFAIEGHAIDLQVEASRKYLANKPSNEVGGIVITNSATVDPSTGHLWICMNGSSRSGVVYEYSPKGKKLREYSFIVNLPSVRSAALTYVTDILVKSPSIYILVNNGVYSVSSNKAPGEVVFPQEVCPQEQDWPPCATDCPQGSCPASRNCKAAIQGQLQQGGGLRVTSSSCQILGPGQGTPAKPNGGCIASVVVCNVATGESVTHTANLDCNPVKYSCQGTNCIADCNGPYMTSNCDNQCTGGGEGGCDEQTCINNGGAGCWGGLCYTPILIDTQGNGFNLTNLNGGVDFDISGSGAPKRIAWTTASSDDAWLVLDRNANGSIDNGTELFGEATPQPMSSNPNGFIALAEFDKTANGGNLDGKIDGQDTIYTSLRLWIDNNHNAISEPNELHALSDLSISSIELDYSESRRRDRHGNWFRYRARVATTGQGPVGRWAHDVWLLASR